MKIIDIIDGMNENIIFGQKYIDLLDKILNIKSPMFFNDNFASDEELDDLISEMDLKFFYKSSIHDFIYKIELINPNRSFKSNFI